MLDFRFRIPGPLMGWMRTNRGKYGNLYDPPEQVAYKRMVAVFCKRAMMEAGLYKPLEGPLSLGFEAFFPHPLKTKPLRLYKDSKPDLDNLIKNVKDALKGIAWRDDAQVAHYKRCAKWFRPPEFEGHGFALVTIGSAPADEYPYVRSAGAIPRDARVDGPEGEGRAGPNHQEGDGSRVASGPAQHPPDGGLREQGRHAPVRRRGRRW
jgi:Holliday junction resolvase RusA-like endonuclease